MNLNTPVELPVGLPPMNQEQRLLLMGSCFAENMGMLLSENKFRVDVNPFGILYNPCSISTALRQVLSDKRYTAQDLFLFREQWHSPMHHGAFSADTPEATLDAINARLENARNELPQLDWLLLTLGTAYVYQQKDSGLVVANCHKQPDKLFSRRRLEVDEIVTDYIDLLTELWAQNPQLKVLFTVSPIRHGRDGMHANQVSKATLLLAIEQLQKHFPQQVFYFPSYEIVLDELRDYRFYADDMLHPSPLAVSYLWERFAAALFSAETRRLMAECEDVRRALAHKPFHPEAEEYKRFLGQIVLKIEQLNGKYPYLDFEKEIEKIENILCRIRLKK